MAYDPFSRGPFPVGVRTVDLVDAGRGDRRLTTEVWYPAVDAVAGQDTAADTRDTYELVPGMPPQWQLAIRDAVPRLGSFPLLIFSHGYHGHRRQSTFFCTHAASHGYVVAAPDHPGNTTAALFAQVTGGDAPPTGKQWVDEVVRPRPGDVCFVLEELLSGRVSGVASIIDRDRVALGGHSFGGFTTLAAIGCAPRVRVGLLLAPAGGDMVSGPSRLVEHIDFDWGRLVPVMTIAAERDSILPLDGIRELVGRIRSPNKLVVLANSDHMHFCDAAERIHELFRALPRSDQVPRAPMPPFSALIPARSAYDVVRGLGLAHLDAFLRERSEAKSFLSGDIVALFDGRGIAIWLESD